MKPLKELTPTPIFPMDTPPVNPGVYRIHLSILPEKRIGTVLPLRPGKDVYSLYLLGKWRSGCVSPLVAAMMLSTNNNYNNAPEYYAGWSGVLEKPE